MTVYGIINYHDITSTTNLYVFVENVLFKIYIDREKKFGLIP